MIASSDGIVMDNTGAGRVIALCVRICIDLRQLADDLRHACPQRQRIDYAVEQWRQPAFAALRHWPLNELRLAAAAVRRHHSLAYQGSKDTVGKPVRGIRAKRG